MNIDNARRMIGDQSTDWTPDRAEPWMDDGECTRADDPDVFFPEPSVSVREAKALCAKCGVAEQCLAYALARKEEYGIWGGKSVHERRAMGKPAFVSVYTAREPIIRSMHAQGFLDTEIAKRLKVDPVQVGRQRRALKLAPNDRAGRIAPGLRHAS